MTEKGKPRLVGINHVTLEVGDVAAALDFYGAIFTFSHLDDAVVSPWRSSTWATSSLLWPAGAA